MGEIKWSCLAYMIRCVTETCSKFLDLHSGGFHDSMKLRSCKTRFIYLFIYFEVVLICCVVVQIANSIQMVALTGL